MKIPMTMLNNGMIDPDLRSADDPIAKGDLALHDVALRNFGFAMLRAFMNDAGIGLRHGWLTTDEKGYLIEGAKFRPFIYTKRIGCILHPSDMLVIIHTQNLFFNFAKYQHASITTRHDFAKACAAVDEYTLKGYDPLY